MSQTCFDLSVDDLQRLEAEAALKEQEASQARARLAAARQRSTSTAITPEFLPPSRPQSNFPLASSPPSAQQDVRPRSIPRNGGLMVQPGTQPLVARYQQNPHHPMKRTKTTHPQPQQPMISPSTNMVRSKSSSAAQNPFTGGPGRVKPISPLQSQSPNMDMMDNYLQESDQQQPANNYVLARSMGDPMSQPPTLGLSTVQEGSAIMEDPGSWLMRMQGGMDGSRTDSQLSAETVQAFGQSFSTPGVFQSFHSQGLPTSQCGSLTSGPTLETGMTRTNSNANQSVSGQIQMLRLNSQSSMNDGFASSDYGSYGVSGQHFPPNNKRNAPDDDLLQIGSGNNLGDGSLAPNAYSANMGRSISVDSRRSMGFGNPSPQTAGAIDRPDHIFAIPMQRAQTTEAGLSAQSYNNNNLALGLQFDEEAAPMERSVSASSIKSTHSQRLRAKDSLHRQIAAGTQLLAPKPAADPNKPDLDTQQGTKPGKDGKVAVTKAKYERPKHPKVKCGQCDEYPDGFRGEHELRRHTEAKHGSTVKKFICVDPAVMGVKTDFKPFTPLDKCKHCRGGKEYGAYYNAAAHLRRAHFCKKLPRAKGPKTGNSNDAETSERRGGKGGGDWPPMAELKKWMEEKSVSMNEQETLDVGTVPDEEEIQAYDETFDGAPNTAYNLSTGDAAFYGVGSNLPIENADVYHDMLNMQDQYGASPVQLDTMGMMPSIGSANFDFKSPISPNLHQGLPVGANAYHSPDVSSSATLTAYNNIMEPQQFSHVSSQATSLPMGQSMQDTLGDFDFSMAFGMNDGC